MLLANADFIHNIVEKEICSKYSSYCNASFSYLNIALKCFIIPFLCVLNKLENIGVLILKKSIKILNISRKLV